MATKLTDADFSRAAERLGVDVAAVKAVTAVESRGEGFLKDGRPVILFERHIFRKRLILSGHPNVSNLALKSPALVNATPGGYLGGAREWDRMAAAIDIARTQALESASWGLFQIMGFHWQKLGFGTVQAFVNAMYASEGRQLDAFVSFVVANPGMHKALQRRDWATFARLYNGPAYKKNAYDVKLAAAYTNSITG